jgi:hypothetical protein
VNELKFNDIGLILDSSLTPFGVSSTPAWNGFKWKSNSLVALEALAVIADIVVDTDCSES